MKNVVLAIHGQLIAPTPHAKCTLANAAAPGNSRLLCRVLNEHIPRVDD